MTVPGIGPIISSAMVAAIGNGAAFSKGRDFGAWLGLVPRQMSTGDRTILGKISKQGNRYLRVLFVQAASGRADEAEDLGAPRAQALDRSLPRSGCTQTSWRSRSPTSSPASHRAVLDKDRNLEVIKINACRPDLLERRTVLGAVKAWPGNVDDLAERA